MERTRRSDLNGASGLRGLLPRGRQKRACASGCSVPGSTAISSQAPCPERGSCTGHLREVREWCHALSRICCCLEFLLPARGFASRRTDGAGRPSRTCRHRTVRPQFCCRRGARASGQARTEICRCAITLARGSSSPTARPTSSFIPRNRAGWGGSPACSLWAISAPKRAIVFFISTICWRMRFGLELIATGGPAQF